MPAHGRHGAPASPGHRLRAGLPGQGDDSVREALTLRCALIAANDHPPIVAGLPYPIVPSER